MSLEHKGNHVAESVAEGFFVAEICHRLGRIENSYMVVRRWVFHGFHPFENYARIPGFRDTAFGISYFGVPETVPESRMPQNPRRDSVAALSLRLLRALGSWPLAFSSNKPPALTNTFCAELPRFWISHTDSAPGLRPESSPWRVVTSPAVEVNYESPRHRAG